MFNKRLNDTVLSNIRYIIKSGNGYLRKKSDFGLAGDTPFLTSDINDATRFDKFESAKENSLNMENLGFDTEILGLWIGRVINE